MHKDSLIKRLLNQKAENILFVFFVVNPISVVVTKLLIDKLKINEKNILIVSFRNTDLSLLNYSSIFIKKNRIVRILEKLSLISISGNKILNKINSKKFILFASWSYKEVNWLLKSNNCIGHYYIEEGSAAYRMHNVYSYKLLPMITRIINNFKNRVNNGNTNDLAFRDDSLGFIGINNNSFPQIKKNSKIILDNILDLKKIYKPKLIGVKHIGLTCAERRLKDQDWKKMISKLIKNLPENSAIKAHPSFMLNHEKISSLNEYVNSESQNNIRLCSKEIIIELEMLFEKKIIIGPTSSLNFYADIFGSVYKKIKLY